MKLSTSSPRSSTPSLALALTMIVTLALTAVQAHFILDYPVSRGFDDDAEPTAPCGGFNAVPTNRSMFPLTGAFADIESFHPSSTVTVKLVLGNNPTDQDFTAATDLAPMFNLNHPGHACLTLSNLTASIATAVSGANATLQLIYNGGDGNLYQCADVTLVTLVAAGSKWDPSQCINDNGSSTTTASPKPTSGASSFQSLGVVATVAVALSTTMFMLRGPASRVMTLPKIDASNADMVARDLRAMVSVLLNMPDPDLHMTRHLCAYVLHTLNRVAHYCQAFTTLEKRFDFIVEPWCQCLEFILHVPDGYGLVADSGWIQVERLFKFLFVNLDGIPEAPKDPERTRQLAQKQKQIRSGAAVPDAWETNRMSDDTRLAALRPLILLVPLGSHVPMIQNFFPEDLITDRESDTTTNDRISFRADREVRTKADEVVLGYLLDPKGQDTIAKYIVMLLDTATDSTLVALRTTALEGIMKMLKSLETPRRVATWVPGISAGIVKVMKERGLKEHHLVQCYCIQIWTFMIVLVLKGWQDEESRAQGRSSTTSTTNLGADLMAMYRTKEAGSSAPNRSQSTTFVSKEWIDRMIHGLQVMFDQVAKIRLHPHWKVRLQFAEMAFSILRNCQRSILSEEQAGATTSAARFLLETLIGVTQDDFNQVSRPARMYLGQLALQYKSQELSNTAKEILRTRLVALPRDLYGPDESLKQNSVKMVQGLSLFLGRDVELMVNYQTLWSYVEPWINVLRLEQLDHHNMDERGGLLGVSSKSLSSVPTSEEARWTAWTQSRSSSARKFGFPRRIHLHLREQATSDAFLGFVRQIGASTDLALWADTLTARIQQDTRSVRDQEGWFEIGTVSTVLLLNHLLLGAANVGLSPFGDELDKEKSTSDLVSSEKRIKDQAAHHKKRKRQVRKTARGILEEYLDALIECSQMSIDARAREMVDRRARSMFPRGDAQEETKLNKRGTLSKLLAMDDEEIDLELPEARIYDYNADVMLRCLLLQGIASVAVVMGGAEFEMELIKVLYVLLEHLGDQNSALIRDTAHAALVHVAFVCHSDSVGDLIQSNYDYVIQQVSQRIAFLSTNPSTPQVLWALIHTVGMPAVSMLEDSVTEIFEALDQWRNKEDQVGEGLFKTLVEIVKVIAAAALSRPPLSGVDSKPPGARTMDPSLAQLPSPEVAEYASVYRIMTGEKENLKEAKEDEFINSLKKSPEEIEEYFTKVLRDAKEREEQRLGLQDDDNDLDADKDDDDDTMSFGELRSRMPKPAKEKKPEPPTKHEALSLRILNKAGYFLTASSPRMQILALEVIQNAIVVLKSRPEELNPAIYACWPQIVNRALQRSEQDKFFVGLHAVEVITSLAEHCSEFLGGHLRDDVWPSLIRALETWTQAPTPINKDSRVRTLGQSTYFTSSSGLVSEVSRIGSKDLSGRESQQQQERLRLQQNRQQQQGQDRQRTTSKIFTKEHRLQMAILQSVSKIVKRVRIQFKDVWSMLLLARDAMLDRHWILHQDVRLAAVEVIKSVATAGHGDSVWLVLTKAIEEMQSIDEGDDAIQMCLDILNFMDKNNL
ncbi:TEL2-interacting protein 1 [Gryganskiella cystojenkinii]|nr:TEL2-interacting protein 1 [Gryganskiella cystojenkinii]